jgi:hypothetical protein
MPRRLTERELLQTLVVASESDDGTEELTALIQEHGPTIALSLGMSTSELEAICMSRPMDRTVKVRVALRRCRERHADAQKRQAENLSIAAANMLVGLSRWHEERVDLDAKIVLGTLLANRQLKAIQCDVEGRTSVTVLREKLKEAGRALPFSDLCCFIDERGLNFRWHGGRGGLVLVSQSVEKFESSAVLTIEFPRPRTKAQSTHKQPTPITPSLTWIGDVVMDLGFL